MGKPDFKNKKGHKFKKNDRKFNNRKSDMFKKREIFESGSRLVVRNLSYKSTPEALTEHFGIYGKVLFVNLLKHPDGELKGCGFVQFENREDAARAKASTNNQPFLGRAVNVDIAIPKKDYMQNVPNNQSEKKPDIEIKDELQSEEESNNETLKNPKRSMKTEYDESENGDKVQKIKRKARLIVRNISFKANEESLKSHFEKYGEVLETTLLKKPDGLLVGCGFIQFKDVKSATKAILETNAKPFLGRPIHVDWAVAKNKYMSHVIQKEDEKRFLANDVKIESESEDENEDKKPVIKMDDVEVKKESDSEDASDKSGDDDDDEENNDSDNESDENEHKDGDISEEKPDLRVSANDAEDGRTIFLKNISFDVNNEDLKQFAEKFGEINYALVCVDKLTEHSKGTAFIRFKNKEDADIFLSAAPEQLTLKDQLTQPMPAMFRERLNKNGGSLKKQPKDSRNLYLVKEGVILASSKAAIGVSASDMAKRLSLEQSKSQILRNLNRFVSKYRLTIHNIPPNYTDEQLKKLCLEMSHVKPFCIKECKIMKHLRGPLNADGKYSNKGYGFVSFTKHEDALTCLRRLNNNPSVFGINNRPIVSFSIEDKVAINARKKRLEKSQIKNPLHKSYVPTPDEGENSQKFNTNNKFQNKRKRQENSDDKSFVKKKLKLEKQTSNKHSKQPTQNEDFSGEVSKPGSVKFRSKFSLREQGEMHKQNVKKEKHKLKQQKKFQKAGVNERIKQAPQKKNAGKKSKIKEKGVQKDDKSFSDLVNKYKSKLVAGQPMKSKWYEQR